jgi:hypothetical protein
MTQLLASSHRCRAQILSRRFGAVVVAGCFRAEQKRKTKKGAAPKVEFRRADAGTDLSDVGSTSSRGRSRRNDPASPMDKPKVPVGFSSEVDTGSRQENASNKKQSPVLIPSKPG